MIRNKIFIALACVMMASLSLSASAFSGGNGTQSTPYKVSSSADLMELKTMSAGQSLEGMYFEQTADIALSGTSSSIIIGENDAVPFKGTYNGMGYSISGLKLSGSAVSGLFGYTNGATIKNVNVVDATLNATTISGGIVAVAKGESIISGCSFTGTAVLPTAAKLGIKVGGIAGSVDDSSVVEKSTGTLNMSMTRAPLVLYVGAVAGSNDGTVSECVGNSSINVISNNYIIGIGGIAGENTGTIAGCQANGSINGTISKDVALLYMGGIVGHNNKGTIERTVNNTSLYAVGYSEFPCYVGGISGYNESGVVKVSNNSGALGGRISIAGGVTGVNYANDGEASVADCLNTGKITLSSGVIGGIAGESLTTEKAGNVSSISSSANLYALTVGKPAIGLVQPKTPGTTVNTNLFVMNKTDVNATTLTEEELGTMNSLAGLNSDAWVFPGNGMLPTLAVVKNIEQSEVISATLDKANNKAAFVVYNKTANATAIAVLACYKEGKLLGTSFVDLAMSNGYNTYAVSSNYISEADDIRVIVVNDAYAFSPIVAASSF